MAVPENAQVERVAVAILGALRNIIFTARPGETWQNDAWDTISEEAREEYRACARAALEAAYAPQEAAQNEVSDFEKDTIPSSEHRRAHLDALVTASEEEGLYDKPFSEARACGQCGAPVVNGKHVFTTSQPVPSSEDAS